MDRLFAEVKETTARWHDEQEAKYAEWDASVAEIIRDTIRSGTGCKLIGEMIGKLDEVAAGNESQECVAWMMDGVRDLLTALVLKETEATRDEIETFIKNCQEELCDTRCPEDAFHEIRDASTDEAGLCDVHVTRVRGLVVWVLNKHLQRMDYQSLVEELQGVGGWASAQPELIDRILAWGMAYNTRISPNAPWYYRPPSLSSVLRKYHFDATQDERFDLVVPPVLQMHIPYDDQPLTLVQIADYVKCARRFLDNDVEWCYEGVIQAAAILTGHVVRYTGDPYREYSVTKGPTTHVFSSYGDLTVDGKSTTVQEVRELLLRQK